MMRKYVLIIEIKFNQINFVGYLFSITLQQLKCSRTFSNTIKTCTI